MTFLVKERKNHRVLFKRRAMTASSSSSAPSETLEQLLYGDRQSQRPDFVTELPLHPRSSDSDSVSRNSGPPFTMSTKAVRASMIPELFTQLPPCRDLLQTASSRDQDRTVEECLPFLSGQFTGLDYNDYGVPRLDRERHIAFLHKSLKKLPSGYVAADASRPWMFYWALNGLATLGEDVSVYKERIINTVRPIQNASGGFGGGNGQMSHLAPTYAILLSLAIVGGTEAYDLIDRKGMWRWLSLLKQPDGGFQMAIGGEEDMR